ncbi:MAG: hypothetical protein WD942_00970 [Dehalococcoidia bacterium]
MDRKYFETPLEELGVLVRENMHRRQVLGEIRDELTYRKTEGAKRLRREVEGILAGDIPLPPDPPREEQPEDQLDLLD